MRLRWLVLSLSLLAILAAALLLLDNNWSLHSASRADFINKVNTAFTASRHWVLAKSQEKDLLAAESPITLLGNAALMHMVADCASASSDEALRSVAARYFTVTSGAFVFGRLVDPNSRFDAPPETWHIEEYQRWFLHAVAPTEYPLPADMLADMFSPDKNRTGTLTHQLFALYIYKKHNGGTPDLDRLIRRISLRIASEAAIDLRVTDLYLQRIAFLLAAGQADLVKQRWVERALAAEQPDGGWLYSWHGWRLSFYPSPFPDGISTSHPTVQGMWLACMVKYRYPDWIQQMYR